MADFSLYLPTLLAHEGAYCHEPQEPGGETYRGITRASNPHWDGWPLVEAVRRRLHLPSPVPAEAWPAISEALVTEPDLDRHVLEFYKAQYWNPLGLDGVHSQSVAEQLADHGVNVGISRPAKMAQYLLNTQFGTRLAVDGRIDGHTLSALNAVDPNAFHTWFVTMRRTFYDYRAGQPLSSTVPAAWRPFFRGALHVVPDDRMGKFLASWLNRTQRQFVA